MFDRQKHCRLSPTQIGRHIKFTREKLSHCHTDSVGQPLTSNFPRENIPIWCSLLARVDRAPRHHPTLSADKVTSPDIR